MRRMMYYIRVCKAYLRIGFVTLIQYPADTVIWILSMLLREASGFIGILTIASVAGGLGNWGIYEICILFSICAIIEAIGQAFLDCVWSISSAIRKGKLDVILVRPASPFVQLLGQRIHFQSVLSMLVYLEILIYSMHQFGVKGNIGTILFLLETFFCGTVINTGLYTIFNSLNFWIVNGNDVAELILTCREFAKYPLHVFPMMIRTFFTYMIPFGFMGYYPVAFLTGKTGSWVIWAMPLAAFGVVCVASVIWRSGLRGYNSTGT